MAYEGFLAYTPYGKKTNREILKIDTYSMPKKSILSKNAMMLQVLLNKGKIAVLRKKKRNISQMELAHKTANRFFSWRV